MDSERIKEILKGTAYPESKSVHQALLQVWNECEQDIKQIQKINSCNECSKELESGTVFCSADCRIHYYG